MITMKHKTQKIGDLVVKFGVKSPQINQILKTWNPGEYAYPGKNFGGFQRFVHPMSSLPIRMGRKSTEYYTNTPLYTRARGKLSK